MQRIPKLLTALPALAPGASLALFLCTPLSCSESSDPNSAQANGGSTAAGGTVEVGSGGAEMTGNAVGGGTSVTSGGTNSTPSGGNVAAGTGGTVATGTGGTVAAATGGGAAVVPRVAAGPGRATVATPLQLIPAPTLAGPALKVDLNIKGRPQNRVTELDYEGWEVMGGEESQVFAGVTFTLSGGGLESKWQKVAVEAPHFARLVGDGALATGSISLTIKGLPAGKHSLLAFHNITGKAATYPPGMVDVTVDGAAAGTFAQSNAAKTNVGVPMSYVTFDAQAGKDVVIEYKSANIQLNGFELDLPSLAAQASEPTPSSRDEHVDADTGKTTLSWKAAPGITSHDVYFGTNPNVVQAATHDSPEYKGTQAATTYDVDALNSIERYYWRIDEVDAQGSVTRGIVWYFRPRQIAFPGAEGYGRFAIGGRGGTVVHVTNLNDDGPGSFRDAVKTDRGPRTIVFDVSGIIKLESRLTLNTSFITVAGQTAPGKGICIRAAPFGLAGATDVVVRHMRVRPGAGTTYDGMGMAGTDQSIIDHSSISWTIDEAFSSRNGANLTLQRTLISEALNMANHSKYGSGSRHGYAASIGGDIGSFHHNLLAHNEGRNWSLAGGLDASGKFSGRLDIFNNVVYNWGKRVTDGGSHEVNFVGNYYKPGAASKIFVALAAQYDDFPGTQRYYFAGNVMPGHWDENSQEKGRRAQAQKAEKYEPFVDEPFFPSYAEIHTAGEAYKRVLSDVGATSPVFDDHDIRIVKETLDGTYMYKGSRSGLPGLPDHQDDVGGYEDYPELKRDANWDTDSDGLPDWWEKSSGLNPASAADDTVDANSDPDGDGYTNLEDYLNWMTYPHHFAKMGTTISVDLATLFAGYTAGPTFAASDAQNGTAAVSGSMLTFTPEKCGFAQVSATVTDQDGSTLTRKIVAHIDGCP